MPRHAHPADAATADGAADSAAGDFVVLRRRADFLRAASARRQGGAAFLLQARVRREGEAEQDGGPGVVRVGFTCSKKLGNAVTRNRAKRRLRALARAVLPGLAQPGWDYVLVGRPGDTVSRDFATMTAELRAALGRIHAKPAQDAERPAT